MPKRALANVQWELESGDPTTWQNHGGEPQEISQSDLTFLVDEPARSVLTEGWKREFNENDADAWRRIDVVFEDQGARTHVTLSQTDTDGRSTKFVYTCTPESAEPLALYISHPLENTKGMAAILAIPVSLFGCAVSWIALLALKVKRREQPAQPG